MSDSKKGVVYRVRSRGTARGWLPAGRFFQVVVVAAGIAVLVVGLWGVFG
jgi:hypothetical protein